MRFRCIWTIYDVSVTIVFYLLLLSSTFIHCETRNDQNEPKKNRIVFRNGFCCRTCRHCSLQSKILCSAFNDTVLDDHARDSFYCCLWIYWLDDSQRILEFPICAWVFFGRGCARKRRRPTEISSLGYFPRRTGAGGLPWRCSRREKANSTSASFQSSRSTSWAYVLFDARLGRPRRRLARPVREQSAYARPRCRRRPDAPSEETGTMKELYSSNAFFSYPTIVCFKPESPVSSAPCITCGGVVSLYRQKKKGVGSWFDAESAPLGGALSWKLTWRRL